jgi:hypothetical protein
MEKTFRDLRGNLASDGLEFSIKGMKKKIKLIVV